MKVHLRIAFEDRSNPLQRVVDARLEYSPTSRRIGLYFDSQLIAWISGTAGYSDLRRLIDIAQTDEKLANCRCCPVHSS